MPRTPRGPIDMLGGYTLLYLDGETAPEDDYYVLGSQSGNPNYTTIIIWGVGLITFGPPTADQQAFIANLDSNSDLSTFPGDYVDFGFSNQQWGDIEIVNGNSLLSEVGGVWVEGVLFNQIGVTGGAWSIGGMTSATSAAPFFWSDLLVTEGSAAGETLTGTSAPETLKGGGGNDVLIGGDGADALFGDAGNDHVIGGDGVDRLWGGDGDDILEPGASYEGSGNPIIETVNGGAGIDTIVLDYSASTQSLVLAADKLLAGPRVTGVEAVAVTGTDFVDVIEGGSFNDQLFGGGGFDLLRGGAGNDLLDAGAPGASVVGEVGEGGQSIGDALSLDYLFAETSGVRSVSFRFTSIPNSIIGWGLRPPKGDTYAFTVSEAGAIGSIDYRFGAFGSGGSTYAFRITDEAGIEVPWYPWIPGAPIVFPHVGTYYLEVSAVNSNVWDYAIMDVTLTLQSADVLTSNVLEGGTGNDTYIVYAGTDQVIENSGEGTDTVRSSVSFALAANVENLTLTGTAAINGTGNGLANVITGNSAANVITGEGGADRLTGGAGADQFKFIAISDSAPGAADLITDFSGKKGKPAHGDKIDLSAIDANANTGANDAFTLVNKFSGQAGQVYSSYDSRTGTTGIYLDVNGDRSADMVIQLLGHINLTAADFIF